MAGSRVVSFPNARIQITETLVDKEMRSLNPNLRLSKEADNKISKYIAAYMDRLKADSEYPKNIRRDPSKSGSGGGAGSGATRS